MTPEAQIALVERYFHAVDAEDLPALTLLLTLDCVFRVETHGVVLHGMDQIFGMFRRLWSDHASVRHHDFVHVPASAEDRIASRF